MRFGVNGTKSSSITGSSVVAPEMQSVDGLATVPKPRLSITTAESRIRSPWSKIDRYSEWAPGVIGVLARSRGVAPSYVVPTAKPEVIDVTPAALIEISLLAGSKAKLSGAMMSEKSVVHVVLSSSAMKASLNDELTNSGYSSDR
jgi:hypothetical protein